MTSRRIPTWLIASAVWIAIVAVLLFFYIRFRRPITLQGAVVLQATDPRQQLPIAGVTITAENELGQLLAPSTTSDATGFFQIHLNKDVQRGSNVNLKFSHPDYQALLQNEPASDNHLVLVRLKRTAKETPKPAPGATTVGNVRVHYSIKASTVMNVGSAVKTFQVVNTANVPCEGQHPCSPNGKWKASIGSATLDAENGNEFRDVRVSCIAGPCPFTKVESDGFSRGGQNISISERNWSDTATFLVEAEVVRPMVSDVTHVSYPAIFGQGFNFTLPSTAEGVTMEVDLNGQTIIFPLGPALHLSWADCSGRVVADQAKAYRCQLKPNYRFQ